MRIFRVENNDKQGMYTANGPSFWTLTEGEASDVHPMPFQDSRLVDACEGIGLDAGCLPSDYRFGFRSIQQMRQWLYQDHWLQYLHDNGFHLSEYSVAEDHYAIGHTQAVFSTEHAIKVAEHSLV